MLRMLKINMKNFMGANYERFPRTLLLWAILFSGIQAAEIELTISPTVLWLATAFLTIGGFIQVLSADTTIESLQGQLMLPEDPLKFYSAFFLSTTLYIFLTKAGALWIVYLAVSHWDLSALIGAIACFFISGLCIFPFVLHTEKKESGSVLIEHNRNNFLFYILRYLSNNKRYAVNTLMIWTFGVLFSLMIGNYLPSDFLPFGFVFMCLNTPLGILLSSDKDLYRQIQALPRQTNKILLPYASFLFAVNIISCLILLLSWKIMSKSFSPLMLVNALLFSVVSSLLTVALEMKFPLLDWKVESDLWHHPRKYIVPIIMMLFALILSTLSGGLSNVSF